MNGYLIKNNGTSVQVMRPGEPQASFETATVPAAMDWMDADKLRGGTPIRCPGCVPADCPCVPV